MCVLWGGDAWVEWGASARGSAAGSVKLELPVWGAVSQTVWSCPLRVPGGPETAQRKGLETADLQNLRHLFTQATSTCLAPE